jgi:hypothetical protein
LRVLRPGLNDLPSSGGQMGRATRSFPPSEGRCDRLTARLRSCRPWRRRRRPHQGRLRRSADQRGPGAAGEADLDVVQLLRLLDVRRAQRRRLHHRRQPVRARAGRLAGAGRAAGRHHDRLLPVQPGGAAQPGHRRALPGDLPGVLRRHGRQHPGHHPRPDRGGLVRHPDLPGVALAGHRRAQSCGRAWPRTPTSTTTASPGCRCWAGSRSC